MIHIVNSFSDIFSNIYNSSAFGFLLRASSHTKTAKLTIHPSRVKMNHKNDMDTTIFLINDMN